MSVPTACQPIEADIIDEQITIDELSANLPNLHNTDDIQDAVAEIKTHRATLESLERELQACIDRNQPPPPPPVQANFAGQARLSVQHPRLPNPFVADIVVPLEFGGGDQRYRVITALNLPALGSRTFATPVGDSTTMIQLERSRGWPGDAIYPPLPAGWVGYFLPNGHPGGPVPWQRLTTTTGPIAVEYMDAVPAGWMELKVSGWIRHSLSLGDWFEVDSGFGFSASGVMNDNGHLNFRQLGSRFGNGVLINRSYSVQIVGKVSPRP
jgi:hypothetical protein